MYFITRNPPLKSAREIICNFHGIYNFSSIIKICLLLATIRTQLNFEQNRSNTKLFPNPLDFTSWGAKVSPNQGFLVELCWSRSYYNKTMHFIPCACFSGRFLLALRFITNYWNIRSKCSDFKELLWTWNEYQNPLLLTKYLEF